MESGVTRRMAELGIELPETVRSAGMYEPAVVAGNLIFVSGQTPGTADMVGRVGGDISAAKARVGARLAMLNAIAGLLVVVGSLDRVRRVVRVTGYVRSVPGFTEQPGVVDGASELLIQIWGEAGRHARTSIGVAELPGGAVVEVELIVELAT